MVASSMNASQRIFEIIDAKPDVTEKPDALSLENPKGRGGTSGRDLFL